MSIPIMRGIVFIINIIIIILTIVKTRVRIFYLFFNPLKKLG